MLKMPISGFVWYNFYRFTLILSQVATRNKRLRALYKVRQNLPPNIQNKSVWGEEQWLFEHHVNKCFKSDKSKCMQLLINQPGEYRRRNRGGGFQKCRGKSRSQAGREHNQTRSPNLYKSTEGQNQALDFGLVTKSNTHVPTTRSCSLITKKLLPEVRFFWHGKNHVVVVSVCLFSSSCNKTKLPRKVRVDPWFRDLWQRDWHVQIKS